jgi:MoxR-like ATPase
LSDGIEADFHRVQFTPDLLPADLTGTDIYRPETGEFIFQKGPLFHNLVLADEINRAPA